MKNNIKELVKDRTARKAKLAKLRTIIAELSKVRAEREDVINKVPKALSALDAGYSLLASGDITADGLEKLRAKYEGLRLSADLVAQEKLSLSANLRQREEECLELMHAIADIERKLWQIVSDSIIQKIIKEVQPELQEALIAFSKVHGRLPHFAISQILSDAVIWNTEAPAPAQDVFDRLQEKLEQEYFGKDYNPDVCAGKIAKEVTQ